MKKSLIALAALATVATAAQAQSSVTMYGVMDLGVATISNVGTGNKTSTALQNGGSGTSRLGFRGSEDLGGGLKANFNLEAEILADTGAQTTTQDALFARASWVGLSGNFGELKLGRMNVEGYDVGAGKIDAYGGNNLGGYIATGSYGTARINNAVKYYTPRVNGVQVVVETGTRTDTTNTTTGAVASTWSEVAGGTSGNRFYGYSASYEAGNLGLYAMAQKQKNSNGLELNKNQIYGATYNLGFVKLFAAHAIIDTNAITQAQSDAATPAAVNASKVKHTAVGFKAPIAGTKFTVSGIYNILDTDTPGVAASTYKPTVASLRADYAISNRTTIYGIYAASSQDNGSKIALANAGKFNNAGALTTAPGTTADQTAFMVGVRHNF